MLTNDKIFEGKSLSDDEEPAEKPHAILYVPFMLDENPDLYIMARNWMDTVKNDPDRTRETRIILHSDGTNQLNDNDVDYRFDPRGIPPGSVVYLLAHGTFDENVVSASRNITDQSCLFPIDEIVARLKNDNFIPEVANQLKALRLYICGNESVMPKALAENFARALGKKFQDLEIDYYNKLISNPVLNNHNRIQKRAAERLLFSNTLYLQELGRAKNHRVSFRVGDVLKNDENLGSTYSKNR